MQWVVARVAARIKLEFVAQHRVRVRPARRARGEREDASRDFDSARSLQTRDKTTVEPTLNLTGRAEDGEAFG